MERIKHMGSAVILGGLIAVGLVGGGSFIKGAAEVWHQSSRTVAVKGLAVREVKADLVLWPLHYSVTANDLAEVQSLLTADEAKIRHFLAAQGIAQDQVSVTSPRVTDRYESYSEHRPDKRYQAEATVLVRSSNVDAVKAAIPRIGDLVRNGVLLSSDSYEYSTEYLFTKLEELKPVMIGEAMNDARRAAQQFAQDSGSHVKGIKSASQGYFSIEDLDRYTPETKKVRVVTSIDYELGD